MSSENQEHFDVSLVIPTLNEAGNIGEVITRARKEFERLGLSHQMLTVDGGSTDSTCEEAEAAGAIAIRDGGDSYGNALCTGFAAAKGDYFVTMDSDLSHEPEFIELLWNARTQADVIIASRYIKGGKADMAISRYILSQILNMVFTFLLRIPVKDISSGFRLYRANALKGLEFEARDFDILEEILIKLYVKDQRVVEVPFHYKPRKEGKSHAKLIQFGIAYLKTLSKMWKLRYGKAK